MRSQHLSNGFLSVYLSFMKFTILYLKNVSKLLVSCAFHIVKFFFALRHWPTMFRNYFQAMSMYSDSLYMVMCLSFVLLIAVLRSHQNCRKLLIFWLRRSFFFQDWKLWDLHRTDFSMKWGYLRLIFYYKRRQIILNVYFILCLWCIFSVTNLCKC